ncbi:MAG: HAMP domain-containing histidine kinase [Bacteroidaceae bacterium]|nr:HAMP domain-containing histidine kinase [Bacteroidaceae bacterium]
MNRNKNFQNEIARKIIFQVGTLTLLLCMVLLAIFGLEMYKASNATLTTSYVAQMLFKVLCATCIICMLIFVALYYISRNVARKSLKPLHEALERERSFTSYASHEFRTPLTTLRGSLEVLIRKPRTENEIRTKIAECIDDIDAMNRMLEDMLTLTRVESGRTSLKNESIIVSDLMNEIISNHAEQLLSKNIHIDTTNTPCTITTDHRALATILNNIVSNAVKYCNVGGSITISASCQENTVEINVSNTGPVIAHDELPHVFEQFYRGRNSSQQSAKGFGLGLTIVRQFADIIGANVTISSDINQLTVFTLTLINK